MWEVVSFGENPYWDMSNQAVSLDRSYKARVVGTFLVKSQ